MSSATKKQSLHPDFRVVLLHLHPRGFALRATKTVPIIKIMIIIRHVPNHESGAGSPPPPPPPEASTTVVGDNMTGPYRRDAPRLLSQLSVPPPCAPAEEGAQTHRAQDGGQEQGQRVPGVVSLHGGDEGEERQQGDRRRVREFNFGSHVDALGGFCFSSSFLPAVVLHFREARRALLRHSQMTPAAAGLPGALSQ